MLRNTNDSVTEHIKQVFLLVVLSHRSTRQVWDLTRRRWHRKEIVVIYWCFVIKEVVLLMVGARFWTKEVNCRFLHGLLDRCIENEIVWGFLLVRIVVLTGAEHVELRWFIGEWFNWLLWGDCKYVIVYYWLSRRLALKYRLGGNWNTRLWKELIILGLDKWTSYCRLWGQGWSKVTEGIVLVFHISLLLSSDCYFLICQRK